MDYETFKQRIARDVKEMLFSVISRNPTKTTRLYRLARKIAMWGSISILKLPSYTINTQMITPKLLQTQ